MLTPAGAFLVVLGLLLVSELEEGFGSESPPSLMISFTLLFLVDGFMKFLIEVDPGQFKDPADNSNATASETIQVIKLQLVLMDFVG